MLAKVKLAKRISTTVFDSELLDLIAAAIADIRHCGIEFEATEVKTGGVVTDYTVTEPLISRAIVTYCVMNFGSPEDYDRLKRSYDEQKAQMANATGYTDWEVDNDV